MSARADEILAAWGRLRKLDLVAAEVGVSSRTVARALKANGIGFQEKAGPQPPRQEIFEISILLEASIVRGLNEMARQGSGSIRETIVDILTEVVRDEGAE